MDERTGPTEADHEPAPPDDAATLVDGVDPAQHAQELLAEHVPLTLLVDLLTPTGETSDELLTEEGIPQDPWWEPPTEPGPSGA